MGSLTEVEVGWEWVRVRVRGELHMIGVGGLGEIELLLKEGGCSL